MSLTIENVVICRIYTVQTISLFRMSVALTKYFFQVPNVLVEIPIAMGLIKNVVYQVGPVLPHVNARPPTRKMAPVTNVLKHFLVSCSKSTINLNL